MACLNLTTADAQDFLLNVFYFKRTSLFADAIFAMLSKQWPRLVNPTFIFTAEFAESLADFNRKAFRRFEPRFGRDYHFLKNLTHRQAQGRLCHATSGRGVSQIGRGVQSRFFIL